MWTGKSTVVKILNVQNTKKFQLDNLIAANHILKDIILPTLICFLECNYFLGLKTASAVRFH